MKVVELSGGVGGARLARGLDRLENVDLTIVVNVGDDEDIHGLHVSPDIDTVVYTLAGIEGPHGWGRSGDTFETNREIAVLGQDNTFQLGDRDLAMNILRTKALRDGVPLSEFTSGIAKHLGLSAAVLPATDGKQRTMLETASGEVLGFQEYFVLRQTRDTVTAVRFAGSPSPAPGVLDAIRAADVVMIAPSNPPLSIWPILDLAGVREAVAQHPDVVAVSPLFGGKALKGPADRVMASLGLPPGNAGVLAAYEGLLNRLIVDDSDSGDVAKFGGEVSVSALETRIIEADAARTFCMEVLGL
ncbi:MAG: 2-phospho-L-lactate transferase CofD family protein [Acidimicrobiia bacterium]